MSPEPSARYRRLSEVSPLHSDRPVLIDLFCKAGGAARGYAEAGFRVIGVDSEPQPRYPFPMIQADAFEVLDEISFLPLYPGAALNAGPVRVVNTIGPAWAISALHASPPCQGYTALRHTHKGPLPAREIPIVRKKMEATGLPWVIENVAEAAEDMPDAVCLCGSMFGLGAHVDGTFFSLERHRLFINGGFSLKAPRPCRHTKPVIGVYGGHVRSRSTGPNGWRGGADFPGQDKKALAQQALGIDWAMTMDELSEAIPKDYARHVGISMMAEVRA